MHRQTKKMIHVLISYLFFLRSVLLILVVAELFLIYLWFLRWYGLSFALIYRKEVSHHILNSIKAVTCISYIYHAFQSTSLHSCQVFKQLQRTVEKKDIKCYMLMLLSMELPVRQVEWRARKKIKKKKH